MLCSAKMQPGVQKTHESMRNNIFKMGTSQIPVRPIGHIIIKKKFSKWWKRLNGTKFFQISEEHYCKVEA